MRTFWRFVLLVLVATQAWGPARAEPTLQVASVVPQPNASAVAFDARLFVQFNRPVVPLEKLQARVTDQPVTIEPPVDGRGTWITTGLFAFSPSVGWAPATTYTLRVAQTDYAWSFSTLPALVASTTPVSSAKLVDPAAPLKVAFNQPLEHASVGVRLEPSVDGAISWTDARTLEFRSATGLAPGTTYAAHVRWAQMAQPYTWMFTTAPDPAIVATIPAQQQVAPRLGQVELSFSAPMDRDDVRANLTLSPEPDYPPFLAWNADDTHVTVSAAMKPSAPYTLSLATGTHDRFGRPLGGQTNAMSPPAPAPTDFRLEFTTPSTAVSPNAPPVTPSAWLIGPGTIGTYDAYAHPRALVRTTNVSHLDFAVDRLDEAAALRIVQPSRSPSTQLPAGQRVLTGAQDVDFERNTPSLVELDLGELDPGYYRLRVEPKEAQATVQDRLIVVTRTMLAVKESASQVLAWATDVHSGEPLAGLQVRLFRASGGAPIATGITDSNGTVRVNVEGTNEQRLVIADRPDDATLALSDWNGGVGAWSFGLPVQWDAPSMLAHLYTDRPIYRPGQTVHVKGIVRADDDAQYALPPTNFSATWEVRDSRGQLIQSHTLPTLSDFGTFTADVDLNAEAATGSYSVFLRTGDQSLGYGSFLVADYQRPTYDVSFDKLSPLVAGQPLNSALHAAYYFGQSLSDAAVHWQVSATPYTFRWMSDPTFRFGDTDQNALSPRGAPANAARAEGKGVTGGDGSFAFQVPTDLSKDLTSQQLTIEATVSDKDGGEVSNRTNVVIHKSGLYLGLKPTTFVATAGQTQSIQLLTLDDAAALQPDVAVHGQVIRRRWLSVRERDASGDLHWISKPEDTPVSAFDARSGSDGRGAFDFTPEDGGQYRVIVEAPDASGNVAHTALNLWVADRAFVPWRIGDDDRLELQADKPVYRPGDVAHVLVPAPVNDAQALISVERGKLISSSVHHLTSNSTVLDIPIDRELVPNAYVSVLLFVPGEKAAVWSGYVELSVDSDERRLTVNVEPAKQQYQPRDTVDVTLRTRDASGKGVPAELSLAMVDAAVLALADSRSDPVEAFWHRRPSGVRTGSSLGQSIDRSNDAASSGLKGGGGGDTASVRQDFPDTAFWNGAVQTDVAGEAHVQIRLPDSLTTWRLTAVAVTQDTRVGIGTADVLSSKQLLVRPIVPRFVVGGDRVTIGAVVHNTTSEPLAATLALRADQLTLDGTSNRLAVVPPGGQVRVDWRVGSRVGAADQATVRFDASSDAGLSDALQVSFPILAWGAPTTVATAGEVGPGDAAVERVDLSGDVDRQRGELQVNVTPNLAAALNVSAQQTELYPYLSLEQTVSRLLSVLGKPAPAATALQRILNLQHADGGWGLWENDTSSPYFSAYALFGLQRAQNSGYSVDKAVFDRATTYLRTWLNSDPGVYGLDGRAFVLYVLGEGGAREPSRVATLFDRRAELSALGEAYLAQAFARLDPSDARVGGLLSELSNTAVVSATGSYWQDANANVKPWLLATDVRTTAAVLDALVRLRPDQPLIPSTVRWMMAERRDVGGSWLSTHDAAMSFVALSDYLTVSGNGNASYAWQVLLNGTARQSGSASDAVSTLAISVPELKAGENLLQLARSAGSGRMYYTLQLRTFALAENVPFLSRGFTVGREYVAPDGKPLGEVHVGDLVRVNVSLLAPTSLYELLLEDPLPAGLEPVDTRLKTTSRAIAQSANAAPGAQPWSHVDVRSDHVAVFANFLRAGTYTYTYLARATLPGEFRVLPTAGREQYFPEVQARTDGTRFTVLP